MSLQLKCQTGDQVTNKVICWKYRVLSQSCCRCHDRCSNCREGICGQILATSHDTLFKSFVSSKLNKFSFYCTSCSCEIFYKKRLRSNNGMT